MRVSFSRLAFVAIVMLVQACATPNPRTSYPRKPAPPVAAPVLTQERPATHSTPMAIPRPVLARPMPMPGMSDPAMEPVAPTTSTPVVLRLMNAAQTLEDAGQFDQAAARIERGLRIAPKDAYLWQRLAQIRLQQKRYRQVVATAKKSNGFARGNAPLQTKNWLLISEARVLMGDVPGAERAKAKASRYQSF